MLGKCMTLTLGEDLWSIGGAILELVRDVNSGYACPEIRDGISVPYHTG